MGHICGILGSIYFCIATPTEAWGVGCFIVLFVTALFFDLRWKGLYRAIVQTAVLNATIMIILVGSSFFTYVFGSSSVAQKLSMVIASLNLPPMAVIIAIMIFLLFLGCFMGRMLEYLLYDIVSKLFYLEGFKEVSND